MKDFFPTFEMVPFFVLDRVPKLFFCQMANNVYLYDLIGSRMGAATHLPSFLFVMIDYICILSKV